MIAHANDSTFEKEVTGTKGLVVVDFWAAWCGPCKMYGPIFEEVSKEQSGKAKFVKVDVEESERVASELGVRSIPTTVFFKDGEPIERAVGLLRKADLVKKIGEHA